ncbi:MAG: hypothetical protein GX144_07295 [Clostridiaceae bacterium]|jgi:putative aldouronate transport system substrate-binding protein|nr:hypothetical protein [Clostridiaceae bacterium]
MMKRIRLIRLILVTTVLLALVSGCVLPTEAPPSGTTPEPTQSAGTTGTQKDNIIWRGKISVAPYLFAPVDESKNAVKPLLEEALLKYGYDVDLECVFIENSQYSELLNVRIVANDAPDIFEAKSQTYMKEYYEQGSIKSWTKEFFIEKCPSIHQFINNGCVDGRLKDYVDMFWDFAMIDGNMVTVPPVAEAGTMLPKVMLLRGDWLEKLGVTELPYSLDDFIDLMYRFAKEDPDNNGEDDTYGFSTSVIRAIFGAFYGYTSFPDPSYSSRIEFYHLDGKIQCGDILPTNKEALRILAKCYADGVIDPEFVAQNGENTGGYWALSQPFINGRIGASCHASIDHYRLPEVTGQEGPCAKEYYAVNGDYNFVYAPWPAGPEGNYGGWSLGPAVNIGENAVYNSNMDDEKLAAILSMLDIFSKDDDLAKLGLFGIEGQHYEVTGSSDKPGVMSLLTNEEMNAVGVAAYRGFYGGPVPFNDTTYRMNYYNSPSISNIFTIQAQPGYKGGYNRDVYETTESVSKYKEELSSLRDETFIKIIRGDLGIDAYDAYVEEYLQRGGQILIDEAQAWWDSKH